MHRWAAHGHMSAVTTGLRMALLQNQMDVEVGMVAPDLARVAQARDQLVQQSPPPPPHRLTAVALDGNFGVKEQISLGSAGRSSAARGGVVVLPLTSGPPVPYNLHECYLYICIYVYMYIQWGAPLEGVRELPPPFWVPLEPRCAFVYNA